MERRRWNGKIETFEIYAKDADECKKEMTGVWRGFKSRVIDVISDGDRALITIETSGRLPIVQKRWDKYRIPPEQLRAVNANTLEYKIDMQKRGRGRPPKGK
jgi:hypothetical protein